MERNGILDVETTEKRWKKDTMENRVAKIEEG